MNDKLVDLAARWNTVNCNGMKPHECATELLSILDAEGDGGAVRVLVDWTEGNSPRFVEVERMDGTSISIPWDKEYPGNGVYSLTLHTHPARSGVVSDEDVSVVAKMIADRVGNGMREKYEDVARQIVELMAERQAAMQGQDGEVVGTEDARERVMEAIAGALGYAFDCTRVWSAWSYGTMSEDDFSLVREDDGRLGEIADAAIAAIQPPQPVRSVSDEDVPDRKFRELLAEANGEEGQMIMGKVSVKVAIKAMRAAIAQEKQS